MIERDTSSSEEEADKVTGSQNDQLIKTLRKTMGAHATLLKNYAIISKVYRTLAPLIPKEGLDKTAKENLEQLIYLCLKSQLRERISANEALVVDIHGIGVSAQVFGSTNND